MRHHARARRVLGGSAAVLAFGASLAACIGHADPGPGTVLGKYHVQAKVTENECGEGALGLENEWEYDVELRRAQDYLLWDNGKDIVEGLLDPDDQRFTFEIAFEVDMRTEADPAWLPPCTIERVDSAQGTLSSADDDVESFDGRFTYRFRPTEDSDCSDLYGPDGPLFHALPCLVTYDVEAERTVAPEDMPDKTRDGDEKL